MPVDRFDREKFEEVLNNIFNGKWSSTFTKGEWLYSTEFGDKGKIFVGSSIGENDVSKSTGKDSIRVYVEYDGKYMKDSQRWTTRVLGWETRLHERIHSACTLIRDIEYSPRCPNCGGPMVIRSGVHGKFYGCLKFPRCRGTRNYSSQVPQEMKWAVR